jgi:hypothetical protein
MGRILRISLFFSDSTIKNYLNYQIKNSEINDSNGG